MITIFRRIRQKLIDSGSVTKYLLYATGEILLVVIGILIAVQVNMALENARDDQTRVKLVEGLITEFKVNLAQLDTVLAYNEDVLISGNELVEIIANRNSAVPEKRIQDLLIRNSWVWTFDPINGVLKSSISSGHIHLLENDSLKVSLFAWNDRVFDAREEQLRALKQYEERLLPFLEQYIPAADLASPVFGYEVPESSFSGDYRSMMFDPQFENNIVDRIIFTNDTILELKPLIEVNREILKLLERE
ncbi:DUF6090 family protein [Balneola sp. MJW-20]|uniref:DUF6090 family protein n=1 Tax=Gracilimonas aurantiaca TaxID=3234185 RepID=UPI00346788AC